MKVFVFVLGIAVISFVQCTEKQVFEPKDRDEGKISTTVEDFGQSDHALAFDLFHQVIDQNSEAGKNVVVSPLSVHTALLMVLNGADNETYDAIAQTLHGSDYSESSINESYKAYEEYLDNADQKAELNIANSVFWDDGRITPHEYFTEKMIEYYRAELISMSLQDPSALSVINDWVKTKTEDRIEKILEEIKPEEVLFLINALYFKGDWSNPFPLDYTWDRNFTRGDGNVIEVPTMSHDAYLLFYQGLDYEAVDLIFGDSIFSMTFIQPADNSEHIDDFIASYSGDDLKELYQDRLQNNRVQVYLPKFETEYTIKMNDALKALGMDIAFSPGGADLSRLGVAPEGNLYISRVEHKTFLKIDEKGAEGAAVTAVGVGVTSVPPTISFDRPFMFVLRDIRYNSVVFIGKIEDPSGD